ncbi:BamA/TamA family outer membrane protein [Marinobacter sp. BGYM27]|uniref:BamA/TamA family outer membrane protein n=1 Tax=Marinobacter sp. BGYM27 TaxID=2975597 RepID=UPI0021A3ADF4|nr:BamA/TamA family outer membrane protein [Marinobacter sp. BGYM27]MDG5499575.1 BamA/TamA family outer membrane protein [Marinobacter sp. BGYM27]
MIERRALSLVMLSILPLSISAAPQEGDKAESNGKMSGKWLVAPVLSNGPKLGLSGGVSVNYLNQFDGSSPASMTGLSTKYSDTDSWTAFLYNRSYWDNDSKRFVGVIGQAETKNDYNDYLGQGPASVDTHFQMYYARYQQRVSGSDWFVGGSYVYTNINPQAADDATNVIMTEFDIGEAYSAGLGLNINFDTRDNLMNPKTGSNFETAITAFNDAFGGDNNYWAYNVQYSYFQAISDRLLIAYDTGVLSTPDAPTASQATTRRFRGYTPGENSAENSLWGQAEVRYVLRPRWELAGFTGTTTLFDSDNDLNESENWYPMVGLGGRYIMDPKSQTILRLDYAVGKANNQGLYLSLGQPF